jgi:ankyrin repeat protein
MPSALLSQILRRQDLRQKQVVAGDIGRSTEMKTLLLRSIVLLIAIQSLAFAEERPLVRAINLSKAEPEYIDKFLDESSRDVSAYDSEGKSLIIWAAQSGQADTIRRLVVRGADVNQVSKDGYKLTPLVCASDRGFPKAVEVLIERGAKTKGDNGRRAVMAAASYNTKDHAEVILILAKAGADVDGEPIWKSLEYRRLESLEALLSAGADINQRGHNEITPALFAVMNSDMELLKIILKHKPNLNLFGRFPFVFTGFTNMPPEERYRDRTPLMYAAESGDKQMIEVLLQAGANRAIKDRHGKTALDIATSAKRNEVIAVLQKK